MTTVTSDAGALTPVVTNAQSSAIVTSDVAQSSTLVTTDAGALTPIVNNNRRRRRSKSLWSMIWSMVNLISDLEFLVNDLKYGYFDL